MPRFTNVSSRSRSHSSRRGLLFNFWASERTVSRKEEKASMALTTSSSFPAPPPSQEVVSINPNTDNIRLIQLSIFRNNGDLGEGTDSYVLKAPTTSPIAAITPGVSKLWARAS
eukprot:Lithocolla_globosa_v1_NODE_474_length_3956_cov_16.136632.p3 type:complete len:114 gc:universal NODE_474_length_3956_cov_16.136632:3396-3055(-)